MNPMSMAQYIQDISKSGKATAEIWIRSIYKQPTRAECLRLIVRDNILGVGDIVKDALWKLL
jgi:hypothetical protein